MFLCTCGGGLRREEGIALDWEDIEFEKMVTENGQVNWLARVKIFTAVTEIDGEKGTKNDSSYRIITLSPTFANPLHSVAKETGPVLFSRNRRRMSASQTPKHWRGLFDEGKPLHGMPYIPISRLRHTNSTLMRDAQVADTVIADFHGHTDIQTDKRHYLVPTSASIDGAALKLEEYLAEVG